nr:hypothetical protein [Tanacetum cinerariifolium]
ARGAGFLWERVVRSGEEVVEWGRNHEEGCYRFGERIWGEQ